MKLNQLGNKATDVGQNVSLSVFKREDREYNEVQGKLIRDGWMKTGSIGTRVHYFEKSGINLTVVDGPMGTLIFPSGPLRGRMFSESVSGLSSMSGIGLGKKSEATSQTRTQDRSGNTESSILV